MTKINYVQVAYNQSSQNSAMILANADDNNDCLLETLVWCSDTPDTVAKHQPRSRDIRNTENVLSEH